MIYPGKKDYKLDLGNNYHGSNKGIINSSNQSLESYLEFRRIVN